MKRRSFLTKAGAAGAALFAAPAVAQSGSVLRWRMASSYPKSLDTIYGAGEVFAKAVAELTEDKFQIRVFAGGEIVPGLQVLDGVSNNTIECGHTTSFFYTGKNDAFAFGTALPFGLNTRQQTAWMYQGGGIELLNEFYKDYNIYALPLGNTGAQMGGWFRKEVNTTDDMAGLKMRIGGLAGRVMQKVGVVPQQIAGGDIYPALEKGTIDATEWIGPYDDEKLGFHKVAKYYYYPAWWEGGAMVHLFVNLDQWNALPKAYKAAVRTAAAEATQYMLGRYDFHSPAALRRLVAAGTQLRPFSRRILDRCYDAAQQLYAELNASNPEFRKIYAVWDQVRDDQRLWFRVAEGTYDNYISARVGKR